MSEQVVLLDEAGHDVGAVDKATVHTGLTPLHLAFSCYVFDESGRLLVTQRALAKVSFPGVWTNSVCGHPAPGEDLAAAVERRAGQELGIGLHDLRLLLPRFRYRATAADGLVENEMCPVFAALTRDDVRLDPAEVEDSRWVEWSAFRHDVLAGTSEVSVWCREQVAALPADPLTAPAAAYTELPPATRR